MPIRMGTLTTPSSPTPEGHPRCSNRSRPALSPRGSCSEQTAVSIGHQVIQLSEMVISGLCIIHEHSKDVSIQNAKFL